MLRGAGMQQAIRHKREWLTSRWMTNGDEPLRTTSWCSAWESRLEIKCGKMRGQRACLKNG